METESTRAETILVVDDDEEIRRVAVKILERLGYQVLDAEDAPSALKVLEEIGGDIDLVFSDVVMPSGMSGYDLANKLRRHYQHIKVLMTSGYPAKVIDKDAIGGTSITLLRKPYKKAQLAEALRTTLEQ